MNGGRESRQAAKRANGELGAVHLHGGVLWLHLFHSIAWLLGQQQVRWGGAAPYHHAHVDVARSWRNASDQSVRLVMGRRMGAWPGPARRAKGRLSAFRRPSSY
jgi:hypothetical protein